MALPDFYKPAGGVVAAELFPVRGLASPKDMIEGRGAAVSLMDDGSSYEEEFSARDGQVSVCHTLVLCSDRKLAAEWFDSSFLRICAAEGVAAVVRMASGERIVAGWCPRFGFEQALRLQSLLFLSGERPTDSPRVKLILACRDTGSAFDAYRQEVLKTARDTEDSIEQPCGDHS